MCTLWPRYTNNNTNVHWRQFPRSVEMFHSTCLSRLNSEFWHINNDWLNCCLNVTILSKTDKLITVRSSNTLDSLHKNDMIWNPFVTENREKKTITEFILDSMQNTIFIQIEINSVWLKIQLIILKNEESFVTIICDFRWRIKTCKSLEIAVLPLNNVIVC